MKHLILSIACAFCLFASADVFAQPGTAANTTTDTWVISCYGEETVVPPGASALPINIGTNCDAGIYVFLQMDDKCNSYFTLQKYYWYPSCTANTSFILFAGQTSTNPNDCDIIVPEFGFNP